MFVNRENCLIFWFEVDLINNLSYYSYQCVKNFWVGTYYNLSNKSTLSKGTLIIKKQKRTLLITYK